MASLFSSLYEEVRGRVPVSVPVVVASLLLLLILPKLLSLALEQWRLYVAFRPIPCDTDQHFLLGHAPK